MRGAGEGGGGRKRADHRLNSHVALSACSTVPAHSEAGLD